MVRSGVKRFLSPRKGAPRCLCSAEFPVQPKRCARFKAPNPKPQAPENNQIPSTKRSPASKEVQLSPRTLLWKTVSFGGGLSKFDNFGNGLSRCIERQLDSPHPGPLPEGEGRGEGNGDARCAKCVSTS